MNWHPHTEKPKVENGTTALIAWKDEDGDILLSGIYMWCDGKWCDEVNDRPRRSDLPYWWALESEIIAEIKP